MNTAILTVPEKRVLMALGRVHYATHKQLARMIYKPTSAHTVRSATPKLVAKKLVFAEPRWRNTVGTTPELIFTYTEQGRRVLASEYPDLPVVTHEGVIHRALNQPHLLGITDTFIAVQQFVNANRGEVSLVGAKHDMILKHQPVTVTIANKRFDVVPDFWIELFVKGKPWQFWLEYDHGTEDEKQWRQKVERIVTGHQTALNVFGVDAFTVMVVVKPDDAHLAGYRAERMLRWTEKELTASGKPEFGQIFLFSAVDPVEADPTSYFTVPHFKSPFSDIPQALITGF